MRQSFIVNVSHKQNATLQGNVTWMNANKTQNFRSAMELLHLIDSTLDRESRRNWEEASKKE